MAVSPIVVKFQHGARLGSGGGQGHWWDEEPAASLPEVSLAAAVLSGVSSPNAELPVSLAALCRPELSPQVFQPCL